jgi:hypothetical protein
MARNADSSPSTLTSIETARTSTSVHASENARAGAMQECDG